MKQEIETDGVLELGCVSADTKGTHFLVEDSDIGLRASVGLTDD